MNSKRKFNPKWQKEDSDLEDDSGEFEEDDKVVEDLRNLLKELFTECQKLNLTITKLQANLTPQ